MPRLFNLLYNVTDNIPCVESRFLNYRNIIFPELLAFYPNLFEIGAMFFLSFFSITRHKNLVSFLKPSHISPLSSHFFLSLSTSVSNPIITYSPVFCSSFNHHICLYFTVQFSISIVSKINKKR